MKGDVNSLLEIKVINESLKGLRLSQFSGDGDGRTHTSCSLAVSNQIRCLMLEVYPTIERI